MKTVDEWKAQLRAALKDELRARRPFAITVLRETLAAIDNAEAAELSAAPAVEHGVIAGGVTGLGAGEVARRALTPEDVSRLLAREIDERRAAQTQYLSLGRTEEAATLGLQLELLNGLMA
ncbi:MAG: hypothetical protein GQE15_23015 [Archangiaceae bacterium]|nr:hypothetical protein [Archangiaceae bacterium]